MRRNKAKKLVKVRNCKKQGCVECLRVLKSKIVSAAENWANQLENPEYGSRAHTRLMNAVIRLHKFQGKKVDL